MISLMGEGIYIILGRSKGNNIFTAKSKRTARSLPREVRAVRDLA